MRLSSHFVSFIINKLVPLKDVYTLFVPFSLYVTQFLLSSEVWISNFVT